MDRWRMPAEWEVPHEATWVAWPTPKELWGDNLEAVREEWTDMCTLIADPDDDGVPKGDLLYVLAADRNAESEARKALRRLKRVRYFRLPYADIWTRDTLPPFVMNIQGEVAASLFRFNGWGDKNFGPHYDRASDIALAAKVAQAYGRVAMATDMVFEPGSIDVDDIGTMLTTRQCLLNPNRNPGMCQRGIEHAMKTALGAEKILWLGHGLENDHTDGHVDTVARFISRGKVACMEPRNKTDPNYAALQNIIGFLSAATDAGGRKLEVVTFPSPGRIVGKRDLLAASSANFVITNTRIIIPTYDRGHQEYGEQVCRILQPHFPGREAVHSSALAILSGVEDDGGGAFHCITQQLPKGVGR